VRTSLELEHKKRRTGGELEIRLGRDPEDKQRTILLAASLDRKKLELTDTDIDYKAKAVVPMLVSSLLGRRHSLWKYDTFSLFL
jgi:hypothetical protein